MTRARLVAWWTDLDCGCAVNEHQAWVFSAGCPLRHWELAPDQGHIRSWLKRRDEGQAYGPVRVGKGEV